MHSPVTGWRMPLKLAGRDMRRYKGRTLLAAALIFLPVLALAGMLSCMRTLNVDDTKLAAAELRTAAASVSFDGNGDPKPVPLPSAGRVVGGSNGIRPTTEQVSEQAHAAVVRQFDVSVRLAPTRGGPSFTPIDYEMFRQTDLNSPMVRPTITLDEGRLPQRSGEVVVTRYGRTHGLPASGTIDAMLANEATQHHKHAKLTVVGVVTAPSETSLMGPEVAALDSPDTFPSFLIAGSEWGSATIQQWTRYGASVTTRSFTPMSSTPDYLSAPGSGVVIAIVTMAFVAVTALLAGPAFAASATRQRRTLGLIAANGATRGVLQRIVLAQALLLGFLTAAVTAAVGGIGGALVAQWGYLHFVGRPAPLDVPVSWLVAVVVVATFASLVAAAVPARSAGRTNLLAALRGQVSPRKIKHRWPLIGLAGIGLGTLCLLAATQTSAESNNTRNVLLTYVGVPLFFGGAVLAVPYVLLSIGRLARFLPLTPRIAVRDVSRQRTRATASVGAVLATVSVLCAASILGASSDKWEKANYHPATRVGSGAFVAPQVNPTPLSDSELARDLTAVRRIVPQATPLWTPSSPDGFPRFTNGVCDPDQPLPNGFDPSGGVTVVALDAADVPRAGFDDSARRTLQAGGAVVVKSTQTYDSAFYIHFLPPQPLTVSNGHLTLRDQNLLSTATGLQQRGCTPLTLSATPTAAAPRGLASLPMDSVVVERSTLAKAKVPTSVMGISLDPETPISTATEHQLAAVAPESMDLQIEHGYASPLKWLLLGLTAGFALIILLTTIVSTLLNDAESGPDMATLAAAGAPRGMRRGIVGAHAAAIGFVGAVAGIAVGFIPGLILARAATSHGLDSTVPIRGTYAVAWWPLLAVLVLVPLVAGLISMIFARRTPTLTKREI